METLTFLETAAIAAMQGMCAGKEPLGANRGEGHLEIMADEAFRIAGAMVIAKERYLKTRTGLSGRDLTPAGAPGDAAPKGQAEPL